MLGKLFKSRTGKQPGHVTINLNDRVQPIHRGEIYEDPLDAFLRTQKLGTIDGGGSLLSELGEIQYCDVEVELTDTSEATLDLLARQVEALGAPKGSKLVLGAGKADMPIGRNEGLAVYLNGTELPDSVYAECDSNVVYQTFAELLGKEGSIHSYWQGPTETALYMYGPSFERMRALLEDFMASYPLCEKARIVQIA